MILGIGLDLCPISRIDALIAKWGERMEGRLFTEAERSYARARASRAEHFAARFAAKEAALKALGVPRGLSWHELEVVKEPGQGPKLLLHGAAAASAARLGVTRTHLSLSHAADMAAAVVVLEGNA
ncbi:MAG: holo-ACP synthase [Deltaproteobacteria bacterium]|nr:holo-ACP synthase [Deltaproteobacteria bacterium]